ncbi:MAG: DEAD/DEAH box helicase family protein [Deltaproteobacteria bacterium]|nr:DEAD/DEAH box helicase family protein [Deltaproteobacteria bacterium]
MELLFDQGTVVFADLPRDLDAGLLPGVLWDPRTGFYRAPAWRLSQIKESFSRLGIPVTFRENASACLQGRWGDLDLRPYQSAALDAWEMADRRAVIALPTGSGKTRLAFAAIARARVPTLCLVPTRILLQQWSEQLRRIYDGPIGCLGDGTRDIQTLTVATFESAYRWMNRIGGQYELLIIDEVHHFGAGYRDEALEMSTAGMRLGLSATPPCDERASDRLRDLVGPVVFRMSVDELAGRYLSQYEHIVIGVELTPAERRLYQQERRVFQRAFLMFRRRHPEADWKQFVRYACRTAEGRGALSAWLRSRRALYYTSAKARITGKLIARHRNCRLLIFTPDNDSAYAVSREHLIMPITCDIGREERASALRMFERGTLRALVSSRVLNEGLDVPDAEVAIIIGGVLGPREQAQRIGRVLRPSPGKRAMIYQLLCRDTGEAFQSYQRGARYVTRTVD